MLEETKEEVYGIDESLDVLKAFEEGGKTYHDVMEDGKVDWKDVPRLLKLYDPVKDAVEGVSQVPKEFSDLSQDEINQLAKAGYDAVMAWLKK